MEGTPVVAVGGPPQHRVPVPKPIPGERDEGAVQRWLDDEVEWPGSYCDTKFGPGNQKPAADFGIHGLWPNYAACRNLDDAGQPLNRSKCWPDFCNDSDPLDPYLGHGSWIMDGTCSGMDQRAYFRATLDFKARFNLTRILADAGIVPSDYKVYCLRGIRDAIRKATGSAPNLNETQLYVPGVPVRGPRRQQPRPVPDASADGRPVHPHGQAPGVLGSVVIRWLFTRSCDK
ncbi:hypothetical protein QOZ80_7BG0610210 [Eleusine coracana subsp. coracana]|nr:hypothetical protein QOZ80_7BG0610210 [Eleusine coracana subsp. coracana]